MPATDLSADNRLIPPPKSAERHRFHLLDAQRGIAAMLVVVLHSPAFYGRSLVFPNGFLAVDFFFCLSGFVIAFSYDNRLQSGMTLGSFAAVRLIRLYPLYALGTTVGLLRSIFITHIVPNSFSFAGLVGCAAFLIPNLTLHSQGARLFPLNSPAWSLFYELVANLGYALLVPRGYTRRLFLIICCASLAFLVLSNSSLDYGVKWGGLPIGFARVGFSFFAGVLLFYLFNRNRNGLQSSAPLTTGIVAFCVFLASLTLPTSWSINYIYQLIVVAIVFPAIVYVGAHCTLPHWLNGICSFLGNASYPLYMLHVPFALKYVGEDAAPPMILVRHPLLTPWVLPFYLATMVSFSWIVGRFLDVPLRKRLAAIYKARWSNGKVPQRIT